jgi:hypothetical protein
MGTALERRDHAGAEKRAKCVQIDDNVRAQKKNEDRKRRAQEPTLASGVYNTTASTDFDLTVRRATGSSTLTGPSRR